MTRILHQMFVGVCLLLALGYTAHGAEWNPTASDEEANTAGGTNALSNITTGTWNTGFGVGALQRNTTGDGNTACGAFALMFNTTGTCNTATGDAALTSNSTGSWNTASGVCALLMNQRGTSNTASGTSALYNNQGSRNTADGAAALFSNTTGHDNTASGLSALYYNRTGSYNTAVGMNALVNTSTGDNNLALGYGAGSSMTSGSGNIYLGDPGEAAESDTLRLGSTQTRAFVAGVAGTEVTGSAVFIDSSGQLGVQLSSARYKQDINPMGDHSDPLHQLRPVTFQYRHEPQGPLRYGLIAEEVATVYPDLVTRDADGQVQGVRYEAFIPLLLNELQRQGRQLSTQAERIDTQARHMDTILQQLKELRAQNESLRAAVGQMPDGDATQRTAQLAAR